MPKKLPPQPDLEDLLGPHAAGEEPASSASQSPVTEEAPSPAPEQARYVQLPEAAYDDLRSPAATFSDDPPDGWGTGEGNVLASSPVSASQLDPVASARASLLEDAARARADLGGPAPPRPAMPAPRPSRGNRAPDIRQALARAAALPASTQYRSRVVVSAAWQFDGQLHSAPAWCDRNWAAWDDGPAIAVPNVGLVRKGEWMVVQNVLADDGSVAYEEIRVYPDASFRSLFMPERANPDQEPLNADAPALSGGQPR